MMDTRNQCELKLKEIFKIEKFYEDQWKTVSLLLERKKVLLVEKTGFGKSLCFQFPATQFDGLTVIFSPLIALMRDQVRQLKQIGVKAECINYEEGEEKNDEMLNNAKNNKIKILYIAPERQESTKWLDAVASMKISLIVVDEAHCISMWGHTFRPAYRRIINLIKAIPANIPILATTATATKRTTEDIIAQVGANKESKHKVNFIKGNLMRNNFKLIVVNVTNEHEKMGWISKFLHKKSGNGLIYTGTRVNTDLYSKWIAYNNITCVNYNAGIDPQTRKEIELGLMANKWKCIVSTNALGMGIDKPDIRFIIHTQIPQSPIHYYQEIGRAGRDGKPTEIILLYSAYDTDLPKHFIENSKPSLTKYNRVIEALKGEPLGEWNIMRKTNLTQTQVRVIKSDLMDQGIIKEVMYNRKKIFEYQYNAPTLSTAKFEELKNHQIDELSQMIKYAEMDGCRMKFLCNYLDDFHEDICGKCDNDLDLLNNYSLDEETKSNIGKFEKNNFPELKVESRYSKMINGVAASFYGTTNIGSTLHRCKYEGGGDFPSYLLVQTLRAFRYKYGTAKFDLILYVPPTESGDLVKNFAHKISQTLKVPISDDLIKNVSTKPQKIFQNSILKKDNVKDVFIYDCITEIENKKIILIDDIYDSGCTIKEISRYLSKLGALQIAPLVIAKTVGGDLVGK